ncbi:hypothetical protein AA0Y32_10305 [Georgenia phoenicis]|uniref:hypothetical protein n=1 Tax=unclassified Georgenia TaxID=2626815 RepID=UPI0039B0F6A2
MTTAPPELDEQQALGRSLVGGSVVVMGAVAYALTVHWAYREMIAPTFGYRGSTYRTPATDLYFYAIAIAAVMALCLPRKVERPSSFVLWVLYIVAGAPSVLLGHYAGNLTPALAMETSIGVGGAFVLTIALTRFFRIRRVPRWRPSSTTFWLLIGGFSVAVYAYLASTIGLQFQIVSLFDVYDVRDDYREGLAAAGGVGGYLISWQANVLNPVIIARGALQRRLLPILAGAFGQLLLFSASGYKTMVMSLPALLIAAWIFNRNPTPRARVFLWGAAALPLFTMAVDHLSNSITWTSLLVRRFLVTPGRITAEYVDFFDQHPKVHLSNSILSPFIEYPYQRGYFRIIGEHVTGATNVSMNGNVFAHGYANAGWIGAFIAAVLLAVVLAAADYAAQGLPAAVPALVLLMPAITLSNSGLNTSLSSHGVALAVVVLALLPRDGWTPRPRTLLLRREPRPLPHSTASN